MQWICKHCGDGHLSDEVFTLVDGAESNEEVRKIIALYEVLVKVCDTCEDPGGFYQGV